MSQLDSNHSKYWDISELMWTVLTKEEDIDNDFADHKLYFWKNSSNFVDSLTKNLIQEFNSYSSLTSDSDLSLSIDNFNYSLLNQSIPLDDTNGTDPKIPFYYFYQV